MPDYRSKVIEELIGSKPTRIKLGLYKWNNLYYIVKPYSEIRKQGKKGGNITKYIYVYYNEVKYGLWELTPAMVDKLGLDK